MVFFLNVKTNLWWVFSYYLFVISYCSSTLHDNQVKLLVNIKKQIHSNSCKLIQYAKTYKYLKPNISLKQCKTDDRRQCKKIKTCAHYNWRQV